MKVYKWHSINLIPHATIGVGYGCCEAQFCDGIDCVDRPYDKDRLFNFVELTVLGYVIFHDFSFKIFDRAHSSPLIGLCYSRRKKKWYRLNDCEINKDKNNN